MVVLSLTSFPACLLSAPLPSPNNQAPYVAINIGRFSSSNLLHKAADLLAEIERNGLFATLEKGTFADIKRGREAGKGLEGVTVKDALYYNPFPELMEDKEAVQ